MLRIGIDEAGLGPTLGPLVVAGAAFRLDGDARAAAPSAPFETDLRRRLAAVLVRPGSSARGRLVVGDSKAIFGPTHDLGSLELPVLAFAACRDGGDGRVPATLDDLLAATGADPAERGAFPWYAGDAPSLPIAADRDEVADAADRLRAALDEAGVTFAGFAADVVPEARLNALLARTPNKADVLFARSADVLDRLTALRRDGEPFGAVLDRQGGRRFYMGPLSARWPQRFSWAIDETPTCSRYRVGLGDAEAEVRFVVGGDAEAPETGLASMLAKYLREAFMGLWNGYFETVCPDVARTAGYAVDARRWLAESRTARVAAGIPDEALVRAR
jgi:ribonuclease HII